MASVKSTLLHVAGGTRELQDVFQSRQPNVYPVLAYVAME